LPDIIAAVDTGAPLTAIPLRYKETARLQPIDRVSVKWRGYGEDRVPVYLVYVTAEECSPQLVRVVFDPWDPDYALIGRNLMKHWQVILNGPEQTMEIKE